MGTFNLLEWIAGQDAYGHPIGLRIGGEDTYKTVRGGIVTLLFNIYILYLFITYMIPVVN